MPTATDNYLSDDSPEPVLAGNPNDTDAMELDSYQQENADGARKLYPPEAKIPTVEPKSQPIPLTRIIGTTMTVQAGAQPYMVLAPDPNRIGFSLRMNSIAGVGSEQLRWSHDAALCYNDQMAPSLTSAVGLSDLPHTGAVYVYCPATMPNGSGSQGITIYAFAISGSANTQNGNDL